MTFETLCTSVHFAIHEIQLLQKPIFLTFLHIMLTNSYLRGRQIAKCAESTRVRKPTKKKCASSNIIRPTPQKKSVPDIDMLVHPDSTVTVHEAMGPVFKDTFTRYDALNGKEEMWFLLVAETFLGSQRVLSINKQFGIEEWNCAEYFTQASQKLEANVEKRGIKSFKPTRSKALVSAKNMPATKQIDVDVDDPADWVNVEESVQFLMESKCKGIRIDFKMKYEPITNAQEDEDDEDDNEVEIIDIPAPKKVFSHETFLILASYGYHRVD